MNKNKICKYYGFTLIELIIVITVLTILTVIAFISFQTYIVNARDSNRLFTLKEINKAITLYKVKSGTLPDPDNIYGTGELLGVKLFGVGYLGDISSKIVGFLQTPNDPITNSNYIYSKTFDNKYFQISGTLEKTNDNLSINGLTASVNGNYNGVLVFTTGSNIYVGNFPSLIYPKNGTYYQSGVYVVNNYSNVPYNISNNLISDHVNPDDIIKSKSNSYASFTGLDFSATSSLLYTSIKLGIDIDLLGQEIYGNKFYSMIPNMHETVKGCVYSGQVVYGTYNGKDKGLTCEGDIIICSGDQTGYTISSCNAGATTVYNGQQFPSSNGARTEEINSWAGGLYQWGNNADISMTTNITTLKEASCINYNNSNYNNDLFIKANYDWCTSGNPILWGGSTGSYVERKGPCKDGYHIMNSDEWVNGVLTIMTGTLLQNTLKLPKVGLVSYNYQFFNQGTGGWYWLSGASGVNNGQQMTTTALASDMRSHGFAVRCMKN